MVGKLIREGDKNIKSIFECRLKGESIRSPIDEQIVYNQLDQNPNAIWSLLLASGYLKVLEMEAPELVVELRGRYSITSNRESGFGRYDVMLEPKNTQDDAFIFVAEA